jgi:hypothetical protein
MLKHSRRPGCTLGILTNVLLTRAVAMFVASDIAYISRLSVCEIQNFTRKRGQLAAEVHRLHI